MSEATEEMVLVPKAELERLRKLEADMPAIIDGIRNETTKERLAALHKKQKENPEKHREQSKKRYELKKEEILAKRKETYQRKKAAKAAEAALACSGAVENPPDSI